MFKKIDDKTVILWIIKDGHFTGDSRKLSYCSDQVQRAVSGLRTRDHRNEKPAAGCFPRGLNQSISMMPFCQCFARRVKRTNSRTPR
ncbi:hypothetical protein [Bradyrhizobium sp. LMG 9283]|uniref:hypothetical protein n=1 Tax=Bradyrhizobium sp. LMG 9283 TaxID=592064 RepID=UPI00388D8EF4